MLGLIYVGLFFYCVMDLIRAEGWALALSYGYDICFINGNGNGNGNSDSNSNSNSDNDTNYFPILQFILYTNGCKPSDVNHIVTHKS